MGLKLGIINWSKHQDNELDYYTIILGVYTGVTFIGVGI